MLGVSIRPAISGMCLASILVPILSTGMLVGPASAQSPQDALFRDVFNEFLAAIQNNETIFDPFGKEVDSVSAALVPSLNLLVASNISSFPLTSVISIHTQEARRAGKYVGREPLGPVFGEIARTLGQGKFEIGYNRSFFTLTKLRARRLDELTFTFAAQNIGDIGDEPVRGDIPSEQETLQVIFDMKVKARLLVLLGAYGLTDKLDIGIAFPLIHLTNEILAHAQLSRNNFPAIYFFNDDELNPELGRSQQVRAGPGWGLGDIAVLIKYRLWPALVSPNLVNAALLADVRLPTGSKENFLGTGEPSFRLLLILDQQGETFAPHLGLGYQHRAAPFDSDEIEATLGLDLKLANSLDLLLDLLGEFDLADNARFASLSKLEEVTFAEVPRSNIPPKDRDHSLILSAGLKYSPEEWISFIANMLVPQVDSGLTYQVAPTFGLFVNF